MRPLPSGTAIVGRFDRPGAAFSSALGTPTGNRNWNRNWTATVDGPRPGRAHCRAPCAGQPLSAWTCLLWISLWDLEVPPARGRPFDPCRAHLVECAVRFADGRGEGSRVDDGQGEELVDQSARKDSATFVVAEPGVAMASQAPRTPGVRGRRAVGARRAYFSSSCSWSSVVVPVGVQL